MYWARAAAVLAFILPLSFPERASASLTVPGAYTNSAGTSNANTPFGAAGATGFTLQLDFAASQLTTMAVGSLINGIGFRLYPFYGTINQILNYSEFDIQIGTSTNSIASLSTVYAGNEGADTILARSGALSIPAKSFVGTKRVNPFYTINFTTPYAYKGGDLLVTITDTVAADTIGTIVPLDAILPNASIGDVSGGAGTTHGAANFSYAPITQLSYTAVRVTEPATSSILIVGAGLTFAIRRRRGG
jgi:hypothetical protein